VNSKIESSEKLNSAKVVTKEKMGVFTRSVTNSWNSLTGKILKKDEQNNQ